MENSEKLLTKSIKDFLKPDEFFLRLIENKFEEFGIELTEEQKLQIKESLRQDDIDGFQINLSEEQEKKFTDSNDGSLTLAFEDIVDLDNLESKMQKIIWQAAEESKDYVSSLILEQWKSQSPSLLKLQKKERIEFAELLDKIWAKPLNLLEILLSVSLEAGARFNEYYRKNAVDEKDFVFEAVTRLHARGCQVGAEALILLRNGFADGAHARWRTLHEICVVARFITQNGNDVAERFLSHSIISELDIAEKYKEYHQDIDYAPPNQEYIDALKRERDELLSRYGTPLKYLKKDYWWAAKSLNKDIPTFYDLEKSAELEHLRPFYKKSNINVHSGSTGAYLRLGSPLDSDNVLLAGSSIYGLGEPGQNIAYSFYMLTVSFLLTKGNLDSITNLSAIEQIMNETIWAFDEVMGAQEREADSENEIEI